MRSQGGGPFARVRGRVRCGWEQGECKPELVQWPRSGPDPSRPGPSSRILCPHPSRANNFAPRFRPEAADHPDPSRIDPRSCLEAGGARSWRPDGPETRAEFPPGCPGTSSNRPTISSAGISSTGIAAGINRSSRAIWPLASSQASAARDCRSISPTGNRCRRYSRTGRMTEIAVKHHRPSAPRRTRTYNKLIKSQLLAAIRVEGKGFRRQAVRAIFLASRPAGAVQFLPRFLPVCNAISAISATSKAG